MTTNLCAFPLLIPFLSNPNTLVSVDGAGQTHFIYIYGDSTLDLVYSNLTFCNGHFMGSLSGTLFEAGIPINQFIAPIASLSDNILASLIDFVTNDSANLDASQQSIQTLTYHLLEGCDVCSNCLPRILADNGDPGDSGPGGSGGGNGWYEDDCLAPEFISPTPGYIIFLCPGQCTTIPLLISDPNASVIAMSGMGSLQVIVNGNSVEICNYNQCSQFEQVTLVASNQCGQSSTTIFIQSQPGWIDAYPYTQDICSGTNANINVNSQGACGFSSNSINYNINLPPGVTTDISTFGNIILWTPFTPNFINTTSSPQIVYIDFYQYCGGNLQQAQVVVYPTPTVNAGADDTVCLNSPISLNGTIGGGATSAYWTTSGTGTFADASSLTTTYTPSTADLNNGTVTLTLTTNDPTGLCPSANDQLVISIGSSATVDAGADQAICSNSPISLTGSIGGGATSASWSTSGSGTFADASSLTTTYSPSIADINSGNVVLTLTTNFVSNDCPSVSDQVNITLLYQPQNPLITVSNNSLSTTSYPNTTYQWVTCPSYMPISGSNSANFTANFTGNIAVIVSNSCGSDTSDCINVNLSSLIENTGEKIEAYPNPTQENITLEVSDGLIGKEYKLQDFTGRVVYSGKITSVKTELCLSSLANGTYYLVLSNQPKILKIVKN